MPLLGFLALLLALLAPSWLLGSSFFVPRFLFFYSLTTLVLLFLKKKLQIESVVMAYSGIFVIIYVGRSKTSSIYFLFESSSDKTSFWNIILNSRDYQFHKNYQRFHISALINLWSISWKSMIVSWPKIHTLINAYLWIQNKWPRSER